MGVDLLNRLATAGHVRTRPKPDRPYLLSNVIVTPYARDLGSTPVVIGTLIPAALQFCFLFAWSLVNAFLVIFGTDRGLGSNVGYFFTVYGLVLFVASPLGGRMVDRFGYLAMIPMLGCLVASMWLSSLADNLPILLIAAVVGGFAMGRPGRSRGRWP